MNYLKSISIIILLSSLFPVELLFFENSGILMQSKVIGDMESVYNENTLEYERKGLNLNDVNFSFYIKGNHRINFKYLKKYDTYGGFNLPFPSEYLSFGTQHFFKNKTSLKLSFSILSDYLIDKDGLFNKASFGFGISKENDSKDFKSFADLLFLLEKRSDLEDFDFLMQINYPVSMQVLPENNTPSKVFYIIIPSLVINRKDIYYSLAFSICRNF